ncbi:MAG TPA: TonB-dependent receptor [Bryobacteraceae bacterium]|nr:TonB-dependent receptor [Bryobacteraceae bacterium]
MFRNALRATLFALFALSAFAQGTTGRIDGVVQDPSGAVIAGAKVTATETRTQVTAQTVSDSSGNFAFVSLLPGFYNLSVESAGFRKEVLNNMELAVGATISQIVKLQVGQTGESVTVDASAPAIQTTDSQIGSAITMKSVDNLPQLARTPIAFAIMQPGVEIDIRAGQDQSFSHIDGQRQGSNNSTLDGIDVNDSVAPRLGLSLTANNTDSVEQVSVLTSGFNPEYGRSAGSEIQLVTRSGTNEYHGNAFDYLRNTDFNANDWFNNSTGVAIPTYIRNIYGGTFGGPIRKNKTFIFGNFQGTRTRQQTTHTRTVPTLTARQGIFEYLDSAGAVHQYNLAAADPLHIGIDPAVAKLLAQYPTPNTNSVGDGLNTAGYLFNNPVPSLEDQFTIKGDHRVNENNSLFLRWSWQRNSSIDNLNSADATFPGQPQGSQGGHRWGFSTGYTATITPNLVNIFTAGHQSSLVAFNRPNRPNGPVFLFQSGWTSIPFTAFAQGRNSPVNQFNDTLSWTKGNHTLKFGASLEFTQQYGYNYAGVYPNVSTSTLNGAGVPTSVIPAGLTSAQTTTFNNLYNDLLGRVSSVAQTYYSDLASYQPAGTPLSHGIDYNYYGFFAQDEWRYNRKLTLNYGVRWDYYGSPHEINGQQGTLNNIAQVNGINNVDNLTVQKSGSWFNKDLNNFAPRFGFAYDLTGDGKTAIRGGYGIFYDRAIGAAISDIDGSTPGFSYGATVFPDQNGGDLRYSQGIPVASTPSPTPTLTPAATRSISSIYVLNPNLKTGYVQSYNLTIQRQLPWNNTLQVAYVGNEGSKLFYNRNVNQPQVTPDFVTAFNQLAAYAGNTATPVPAGNLFVQVYGSPGAAVTAVGSSNLTQANVGGVINTLDVTNYAKLNAAGISEYYFRHYPQFQTVILGTNDGRSNYNSMQVRLVHNSKNIQVAANYTFSKSIDNTSVEGNGFTSAVDNYNLHLNRAVSDFDRRHSLNALFTYTLPIGHGQKFGGNMPKFLDTAIGGWNLGGTLIDQSGYPFSVASQHSTFPGGTTYATYTGTNTSIGQVSEQGGGVYYFTPAQVAQFTTVLTPAFQIGNAGRNIFRNPWFNELDMSLIKSFKITERQKVSFRAEGYNVFNHPNFGGPATNITTPASFGKFSTTLGTQNGSTSARTMQLALRYEF